MIEVASPGVMSSIQDAGRPGWRRFGVPPSGAMDRAAWRAANRLLFNAPDVAVIESLQGARFLVMRPTAVAIGGAWGALAWMAKSGEIIEIPPTLAGVWHYLALPGGVVAERFLGSASVCARAGIGTPLSKGDTVTCAGNSLSALPAGVKCRQSAALDSEVGPISTCRVWPGPQWESFDEAARKQFFTLTWRVSSRSDRSGYRLEGAPIAVPAGELVSEPVRVGSVQVPPGGQPLVTWYDGPTVGGYAKIALVDPEDLDRLAQTRPGQSVRFQPVASWKN